MYVEHLALHMTQNAHSLVIFCLHEHLFSLEGKQIMETNIEFPQMSLNNNETQGSGTDPSIKVWYFHILYRANFTHDQQILTTVQFASEQAWTSGHQNCI